MNGDEQRGGWGNDTRATNQEAVAHLLRVHSEQVDELTARIKQCEGRLSETRHIDALALSLANLLQRLDLLEAEFREHTKHVGRSEV